MASELESSGRNTPDKKELESPPTAPMKVEDVETVGALRTVDAETEAKLIRKLDLRIIPMLCWIYLMNFMDRVNIGNGRLYGLEEDLGMVNNDYQLAVSVLFITYCLFETPSNMIIKKMQPARYLSGLLFCWGMVATFSAFVQSKGALIACRLLLGTFEAGLFPGVILYLSMFYNKRHVSVRNACFYGTSAIAGALGGLVAYAIGELDGTAGWSGWRWIILINGIPTVLTAPVAWWILPNSPETASFLNEEDRRNMILLREAEVGQTAKGQQLLKEDVIAGARDWKTWAMCVGMFAGLGMLYSFSVFLPTIIGGMGDWSSQTVQALTIPVYFSGFAVYVFGAWYSDRLQQRGLFVISGFCVCIVGYIFLIANANVGLSFAGCFVVAMGLWTATGAAMTWINVNNPRYGKRAFSSGMQITIGNSAGVAAPFLYGQADAPEYYPGYGATIGLLVMAVCIYTTLHFWYKKQNARKLSGAEDWRMEGKTEEEINELGEFNPRFLYTT